MPTAPTITKAVYRHFTIMDTGKAFIVLEGARSHEFKTFDAATQWIDQWYADRKAA